HTLIVDEPEEKGGTDTGVTPSQLLAFSLAACTAITIEIYAGRNDWEVGEVEVEVEYELMPRERRAWFDVAIKLPDTLPEDQVASLVAIAAKCPVHRTLKGDVEISDRVERVAS